jgi:hypothetical protein
MHKPLVFPVNSFGNLFEQWEPYSQTDKWNIVVSGNCIGKALEGKTKKDGSPNLEGSMIFGSYCQITNKEGDYIPSLSVKPKPEVIKAVLENTIIVEYDSMTWKIIIRSKKEALVICSHGLILGSTWVAMIDPSTVPIIKEED